MRNLILVVAFVFVSITMNSQENEAFKKDTESLVGIVTASAFEPIVDQFSGMVAVDKKEAFLLELDASFSTLYVAIAKIYMEEFTHDEIKEMLKFYDTPVGKKLASKQGILTQKGMLAGQSWGMEIQSLIQKFQ